LQCTATAPPFEMTPSLRSMKRRHMSSVGLVPSSKYISTCSMLRDVKCSAS